VHYPPVRYRAPKPQHPRYLSLTERTMIADLHRAGVSVCGIAHEAERPRRSHESFAATPTVVAATCLRRRSG